MEPLLDTDPKLLAGWNSADLCENQQAVLLDVVKELRRDLYALGVRSKMRHHAGMYLIAFKVDGGDILDRMKVNLIILGLKNTIRRAKEATAESRAGPSGVTVH